MRKKICYLILLAAVPLWSWSQETLVPKKNLVDKKWITNQQYQMNWFAVRDTTRIKIGVVTTKIDVFDDKVQVITQVKMGQSASSWIDSTRVLRADLSPLYHSSYNAQREMSISFGKEVTGFYRDKGTGKNTEISQQVKPGYFDSNFYPNLINWLPFKPGYSAVFDIYDYNPKGKMGVIKAHILAVSEGEYLSKKLGKRKVWVVEVSDELNPDPTAKSTYQIDQLTRQLYKQKISSGGRLMEMVLVEN